MSPEDGSPVASPSGSSSRDSGDCGSPRSGSLLAMSPLVPADWARDSSASDRSVHVVSDGVDRRSIHLDGIDPGSPPSSSATRGSGGRSVISCSTPAGTQRCVDRRCGTQSFRPRPLRSRTLVRTVPRETSRPAPNRRVHLSTEVAGAPRRCTLPCRSFRLVAPMHVAAADRPSAVLWLSLVPSRSQPSVRSVPRPSVLLSPVLGLTHHLGRLLSDAPTPGSALDAVDEVRGRAAGPVNG